MTTTREQLLARLDDQEAKIAEAMDMLHQSTVALNELVALAPIDYPELAAPELWILPESEELS